MEKKLPEVFANPFEKKLNNTQEIYYGKSQTKTDRGYSINEIIRKINNIFNSPNHVFKSKVLITTKDGESEVTIIGKNANGILTMEGKIIKISDIIDIQKK